MITWDPYESGLPEFGHQIYCVIEHRGGVMKLPSFKHFVKSWVNRDKMAIIWAEDSLSPQHAESVLTPQISIRIKLPCWTRSGCLEELQVVSRDTTDLVSGKPRFTLPELSELGESRGQGSNEGRTLHSEALSVYRYFQSSWENRIVYEMDCDRAVSCPDSATHMPCVLGKIICGFLIWTADICYMDSLNILPVINIKSLFTFHGQFCSFSTRICSFEKIFLPTAWGEKEYLCVR